MLQHLARGAGAALTGAAMLLILGCAPEAQDNSGSANAKGSISSESDASNGAEPEVGEEATPRQQSEDCGWELPTLASPAASLPSGGEGELGMRLPGAWQHTHIDSGGGFESIDGKDIRYVFPSTERMLYCQHVPGVTDFAEQGTEITLEGQSIVLPGSHPGFTVQDWSDSSMVWVNNMDGSLYLLQRR